MNKQYKKEFYEQIGIILRGKTAEKQLTVSVIARLGNEQYNTVRAALEGKPFYLHQALWISDLLDLSIDELLFRVKQILMNGEFNGEEEKEESKSIESFI